MPSVPYLSVVAEARNGVRSFAGDWQEQVDRYGLPTELIVSAPGRRNSGIRQARGEFVLATNIEDICSEELMQFLGTRKLAKDRYYRADRCDAGTTLWAREGVFSLTPAGFRANAPHDITRAESGIFFGNGWFPAEAIGGRLGRFCGNDAEILITHTPRPWAALDLVVERGPGVRPPAQLQIVDSDETVVGEWQVAGRRAVRVWVPPSAERLRRLRLRSPQGGWPKISDLHVWNFRCLQLDWADPVVPTARTTRKTVKANRPTLSRLRSPGRFWRALGLLRGAAHGIFGNGIEGWDEGWSYLERSGGEMFRWASAEAGLVIRRDAGSRLAMLVEPGPGVGGGPFVLRVAPVGDFRVTGMTYLDMPLPDNGEPLVKLRLSPEGGAQQVGIDDRVLAFRVFACAALGPAPDFQPPDSRASVWMELTRERGPAGIEWPQQPCAAESLTADMGRQEELHLNAAGDFILMARDHWHDLRGFPEVALPAAEADALLCLAARTAGLREETLPAPMQIRRPGVSAAAGAVQISEDGLWIANQMRSRNVPAIFNTHDWGLR